MSALGGVPFRVVSGLLQGYRLGNVRGLVFRSESALRMSALRGVGSEFRVCSGFSI